MAPVEFPRRGDVFRVWFGPVDEAAGHAIRKSRPAVVVSNDHLNELAATVLVMLVTAGQFPYQHWLPLNPPEGGVSKPSRVVTEQIHTVDKRRLRQRLGQVSPETMATIEAAIRDH